MLNSVLTPDSTGSFQGNAMKSRALCLPLLAALSIGIAAPALAQPGPPPHPPQAMPLGTVDAAGQYYGDMAPDQRPDPRPEWRGGPAALPQPQMPAGYNQVSYDQSGYQQARAEWLNECRRNHGNGKTVGGAVLGGLLGGVIGNRVAGRGSRAEGTVIGAAAGAIAGGAICSAADRRAARDYCEAYLDHYSSQQGGYGQAGYSYGYQPMVVMVPVMMPQAPGSGQRECTETVVTEEYVTMENVPVAPRRVMRRMIRPRMPIMQRAEPVVPDKRVRIN